MSRVVSFMNIFFRDQLMPEIEFSVAITAWLFDVAHALNKQIQI